MRYLVIYRPESGVEGGMPDAEHMQAMGDLIETMMASGSLISTEPLGTRDKGGRVRLAGGEFTVSDEAVRAGGFAFLNADSREAAIALCKTFLKVAGDGTCELRQVMEFGPPPA
ncbi:YciI family protein [Phenylobacterium sp.]|uniref:YciI family protein n=1 Tax=Phenylobacterium sp. TaxID=1871053 RepID=UPI0027361B55|nr:YciI family protein [Phenylobacterium sp.]MDP3659893.1 YciI family protein [Phenylobacterium sp.]